MMGATGFDGFRPFLLAFLPFAATTTREPRREVTGEMADRQSLDALPHIEKFVGAEDPRQDSVRGPFLLPQPLLANRD